MKPPLRARLPRGLIGMIAIVGLIELAITSQPARFLDTTSLNWRLAADDVAREARRVEVACFGDSLVKIAVIPEVIRLASGKRAYNFGMARAPAQATEFLFRRLIEAGGKPSALVVDFKSSIQSGRPRIALRQFEGFLDTREAWEFAREDGSPRLLPTLLIGRLVPSIRCRLEVREAIKFALDGEPAPTARTNRLALRNWTVNLGNHSDASTVSSSGEIPPGVLQGTEAEGRQCCHRINERAIDRLFALAESRSIPVYWILPPMSPALQALRESSPVEDRYTSFVRSMAARHPGVTVVDGRRSGYSNSEFADSSHLNARGSMAFSHELAAILASPQGRPTWVDLPRYREWPVDVRVEDIEASRVAVEGVPARR